MKYENNWDSLNKRPVPEWFEDAKLGIFIHWGLYSVPAYAPKGNYAEWYGYHCDTPKDDEISLQYYNYHKKNYGEDFKYADFVSMFKADAFDAKEWVELFRDAGAKYINLVSKHHDGFCMYKSDYAWNWNSVDVGPHRDFCKELKEACEGTDVRFGVYHSVYEWFHPLYLENPEKYAVEHLIPMLKELIEKYQPNTLFTDGEWEHESSVWHSTDFLQWLYNESSVKDVIVPNDRWGSETRGRLGGNLTTEYGITSSFGADDDKNIDFVDRVSEECRGIGASFGINKFETVDDYLKPQELIELFVDLLSKGSNLLLNIGPTADGRIPVIMEERLRQLGKWVKLNSEGIYGSRKYCVSATENVKYTKSKDGKSIYAFLHKYPFGEITLNEVDYSENITAELFGYNGKIEASNNNGKLKLNFGSINPESMSGEYVYVVKLQNDK
ncbi:MAG: alpha-L-fucosidase [Oscillospiraceae bacterium]|nr:alpha-L-fucosidase [Oscillospiraceae bacterium]